MASNAFRMTRRTFLQTGATMAAVAAAGGMGILDSSPSRNGRIKAAPLSNHKRMVIITLRGGNDGLNTVIPASGSAQTTYDARRPTIKIDPGTSLSLTGGPNNADYRLHNNLVQIQGLWNMGDVALINKVGYPSANLSHFVSEDIWSYGVRGSFNGLGVPISGWIARFADLYANTPTGAVSIGQGRPKDFTGGSTAPLVLSNLAGFRLSTDGAYTQNDLLRKSVAQQVLDNTQWTGKDASVALAMNQAYELSDQVQGAIASYSSTVTYVNQNISNQLKDVARLIQAGFDTRLFFTGYGGFDTHSNQIVGHGNLMAALDNAVGSFAADMQAMGVWQDITIVVVSEFGRRNYENGSTGTDHGHANPAFVIGGSVNGGVYGPDITATDLNGEYLGYDVDFRAIYKDVIAHMGYDPAPVFPETLAKPNSPGAILP